MHSWGENGARNAQVEADQHTCERCNACMRHERERESLTWKEIGGVGGMRSRHCPRSLQRKESKSEESPRAKNMQSRDHVTYMTHAPNTLQSHATSSRRHPTSMLDVLQGWLAPLMDREYCASCVVPRRREHSDAGKRAAEISSPGVTDGAPLDGIVQWMEHEPLMGQDKWLGGVLGADGCAYGVPGHARHILRIDPQRMRVTTFWGPREGKYKWLRGAAGPDGAIYCMRSWARTHHARKERLPRRLLSMPTPLSCERMPAATRRRPVPRRDCAAHRLLRLRRRDVAGGERDWGSVPGHMEVAWRSSEPS